MGGEHKCPLCSATFTRPQHVGRHLRAHTGDRPYECKDCPLRFARSDLLSRHVNKAHRPPDENGKPQPGKKGRRKSMPSSAQPKPPLPPHVNDSSSSSQANPQTAKARRASFDQSRSISTFDPSLSISGVPLPLSHGPALPQAQQPQTAQAYPAQPPLQAQSIYPHHPLLVGSPNAQPAPNLSWSASPPNGGPGMMHNFTSTYPTQATPPQMMPQTMGSNGLVGFAPPFTAVPMRLSGSDQGGSPMGRQSSAGSWNGMGYEYAYKKRACDQCNHSKVRCDFAEPCHRCANRGLGCSYLKPQKSRTIATIPTQRLSLPMSVGMSNVPASLSLSSSSASPHSQFSSPHSSTSPPTVTMQPPMMQQYPPAQTATFADPQQFTQFPSTALWQNNQWPGMTAAPIDRSLGVMQASPQTAVYPPAQLVPMPSSTPQYHVPLPHRNSASSSIGSPKTHLAPTPSLTHTSQSTSPSGSDEPRERRTSSFSFTNAWQDPKGKGVEIPIVGQENYLNPSYSPSTVNTMVNIPGASSYQPDMGQFAWAPPATATIDPRMQFRTPTAPEEEPEAHTSRPSSSTASTYLEGLDENMINAINEQRRRSSIGTGIWANAFNQMSLQDPATLPPDLYAASQMAASARRPSFPVIYSQQDPGVANKVPSLGDVKDLWKLFMSEPMSNGMVPSSSNENIDSNLGQVAGAMITPRPGMGARGLSKSSSMPDLTSPFHHSQPFFSTYMNGVTPKPTLPQGSYTNQQVPEPAVDAEGVVFTTGWKNSIKNRQASFELNPNVQTKVKSPSPPNFGAMSPPETAQPPQAMYADMGYTNRPLASVLQHSSALQQTLAPERVPSFGGENLSTPTKNTFYASRNNAAKFSSALARPGNKRLASQTLVPNDGGKKVELDVSGAGWGPEDDLAYAEMDRQEMFMLPTGVNQVGGMQGMSGLGGTGMTPGLTGGQGQYFAWNVPTQGGV